MGDDWLTTEELLRQVPIEGERPDAILKRLRSAGILERPKPQPRGYGRGVGQLHPPGTEDRLRDVLALRARGVRSLKEVRWWLWFDGGDDLWPLVQQDLVEAYPLDEQTETEALMHEDPEEGLLDAVDRTSLEIAGEWSDSHHRPFDRRAVHSDGERTDLIATTIESALPRIAPDLTERLDDDTTETRGRLLDRAYGPGAADTLQRAMDLGVTHWAGWYDALRTANAPKARLVATLWQRAFGPKIADELRFSVSDWDDRAVTAAALLFAVERGLATSME